MCSSLLGNEAAGCCHGVSVMLAIAPDGSLISECVDFCNLQTRVLKASAEGQF